MSGLFGSRKNGRDVPPIDDGVVDAVIEDATSDAIASDLQSGIPRRSAGDPYANVLGESQAQEGPGAETRLEDDFGWPTPASPPRPSEPQPEADASLTATSSDSGLPVESHVLTGDRTSSVLGDPETGAAATHLETAEIVEPRQAASGTGRQPDDGPREAVAENDDAGDESEPAESAFTDPSFLELPRFGPPGRLTPEPRVATAQPPSWVEQVPDTAIEWLELEDLSVRGISVRGHVHRYEGSVRQDQLAMNVVDEVLVCAIGDGVGSEDASHIGSAFVTRFVVSWSEVTRLVRGYCPAVLDCSTVAQMMGMEARNRGLTPRSLSSTLTFMVTPTSPMKDADGRSHWPVVVGQIGDSHAYLLKESRWERVGDAVGSRTDDDYASNVVSPLPRHDKARLTQLDLGAGDVLALTTDGVGNTLEDVREYAEALARLWAPGTPTPAALLNVLDGSVKSYDDDRTMVGVRFGANSER